MACAWPPNGTWHRCMRAAIGVGTSKPEAKAKGSALNEETQANVTGLARMIFDLTAKRIEVLNELLPGLSRLKPASFKSMDHRACVRQGPPAKVLEDPPVRPHGRG